MSDVHEQAAPDAASMIDYSPAELARFAGADELRDGCAVAGEAGARLRARLLSDELAAGHRLMMRLAARANYAMSGAASVGGRHALPFDSTAERLAGMAGRLMDQYRRGLLSMRKLGGSEEQEGVWIGVAWEGVPPLSPEETARRIDRMRAAKAANDNPDPQSRPRSPAEHAALAEAEAVARELREQAQVANWTAVDGAAGRESLFLDELSAGHRMMMRLAGRADFELDRVGARDAEPEPTERVAMRLAGTTARLMERVRQGLLALGRLQPGPDGGPGKIAGMYWAGPRSRYDIEQEAAEAAAAAAANAPAAAVPAGHRPTARIQRAIGVQRTTSCVVPATGARDDRRRGRLRHGNPSGDFLAAPRCGAATRAGACCRQPAMANGRCRLHGGKSTGPRTAAGRARSCTARLSHGFRSAEVIELRKAAAAAGRRCRALLSGAPLAGHGVHRHDLRVARTSSCKDSSILRTAGERGEVAPPHPAAARIVPISAGHGLHRHKSRSTQPHRRGHLARASERGLG